MKPDEIVTLYEYKAWADRRVLEAASTLTTEQFTKELGSSFASVRGTLAHIYGGDWLWLERFQGRSPVALPVEKEFTEIRRLKARWAELETIMLGFVRGLTQEDLERIMEYKTLNFDVYRNPLWQSMMHLVNHGTYHRGQVTTMLRQLGAQPILTDLMHFYREQAAAAKA